MEMNKRMFIGPALFVLLNYIATLWILLAGGIEQVGVRPFLPYLICQIYIVIVGMPTERAENRFQKICIWSLLLIAVHVFAGVSGCFFVAESFGSAIEWLTLFLLSDIMVALVLFLPLSYFLYCVKKKM